MDEISEQQAGDANSEKSTPPENKQRFRNNYLYLAILIFLLLGGLVLGYINGIFTDEPSISDIIHQEDSKNISFFENYDFAKNCVRHTSDENSPVSVFEVSPTSGAEKENISIKGKGFSSDVKVAFNGIAGGYGESTNKFIFTRLPKTSTGPIYIISSGECFIGPDFTYNPAMRVRTNTNKDYEAGFVLGELLIVYNRTLSEEEIQKISNAYGLKFQQYFPSQDWYKAQLNYADKELTISTMKRLEEHPDVEFAALNSFSGVL